MMNRIVWIIWWVGAILVALSWVNIVPVFIGWIGFGIAFSASFISVIARKYWLPPKTKSNPQGTPAQQNDRAGDNPEKDE